MDNVQTKLKEVVQRLNATPWTMSRTVTVTFVGGQTNSIAHGLGRVPIRWAIDDVTGNVWSGFRVSWDSKFIAIAADFDCVAVLRVE